MFGNKIDVQNAREFAQFCAWQMLSGVLGVAFAYLMVGFTLA
jgi:hypothetical protein